MDNKFNLIINESNYPLSEEELSQYDILSLAEESFHVLHQNEAFYAKVLEKNWESREIVLEVGAEVFKVKIEDSYDLLIKRLGFSLQNNQKLKDVKAPMPGLVLDIQVAEGDPIEKGQALLILEAMKMENVIKAEGEGVIKSILIKKGNPVDKGQVLIEME